MTEEELKILSTLLLKWSFESEERGIKAMAFDLYEISEKKQGEIRVQRMMEARKNNGHE